MSESFSVGEIAIWARPLGEGPKGRRGVTIPFGAEVTVVGAWMEREIRVADGILIAMCHEIEYGGHHWASLKGWLRKRPPKKDWKQLCSLTDLPREVTHV